MKMIMTALAAAALLAGVAAPASAEIDIQNIAAELAKVAAVSEAGKYVKERLPRQIGSDTNKHPVGSSEWLQQVERDLRGRRK